MEVRVVFKELRGCTYSFQNNIYEVAWQGFQKLKEIKNIGKRNKLCHNMVFCEESSCLQGFDSAGEGVKEQCKQYLL